MGSRQLSTTTFSLLWHPWIRLPFYVSGFSVSLTIMQTACWPVRLCGRCSAFRGKSFVDATAAPIASISPISSWVGYEVDLIQQQIDRIIEIYGAENLTNKDSAFAVFLQTIKYRYYPIFMIVLMLVQIWSGRDYGSMVIAKRKTRVYEQKDGGAGKGHNSSSGVSKINEPSDETHKKI